MTDGYAGETVILFQRLDWATFVDYGSTLIPVTTYPNMAACDSEKNKRLETAEDPFHRTRGAMFICKAAQENDLAILRTPR